MLNGLYLYSASLTSGHSKRFTILPHIHPFMNTFTHRRRCQPCKASTNSSGAGGVRCLAQGHLDTRRQEEPGIEVATFRLPANPLYLLSNMPSKRPNRDAGLFKCTSVFQLTFFHFKVSLHSAEFELSVGNDVTAQQ